MNHKLDIEAKIISAENILWVAEDMVLDLIRKEENTFTSPLNEVHDAIRALIKLSSVTRTKLFL
jgi:hypothetical protein